VGVLQRYKCDPKWGPRKLHARVLPSWSPVTKPPPALSRSPWYELARNPRIAATARAEIDQRFPGPGRSDIAFDDMPRLRYLRRVVDETLRLHPPAPGYFCEPRHDTTIGDGRWRFRPGDWVPVLTLAAHSDRSTWGAGADVFDPDRWLPDRQRRLGSHIDKPFGTGPHACLGREFALHETMLPFVHLLHAFDFHPESGYHLDISEQITLKPNRFRLRLTPDDDSTPDCCPPPTAPTAYSWYPASITSRPPENLRFSTTVPMFGALPGARTDKMCDGADHRNGC
jgi:hypothetical protein